MGFIDESQLDAPSPGGGRFITEAELDGAEPLVGGGQSELAQQLIGQDNPTDVQKFGRAVVGGISQFIPFGDEIVAYGASGADKIGAHFRQEPDVDTYDQRLQEVRDYQKAFDEAVSPSTTASVFTKAGPALLMPGPGKLKGLVNNPVSKVGASAVENYGLGAMLGFASGEGTEDRIEKAKMGGAIGGLVGAGAESLGQVFFALGDKADDVERALDRKSIGARQSDYSKTANQTQRVETPDGDFESLTKNALDDLLSKDKLGKSRDPSTLLRTAEEKMSSLSDDVRNAITPADAARTAPAIPAWSNTRNYLGSSKMPADEVAAYTEKLLNYENSLTAQGDGSYAYLQAQKQSLANKWDPANKVSNNFWRAVYRDMQETIESAAPGVKPINKEMQRYILAKPILERSLSASENAEPVTGLMQGLRTSGGGGVPLLAGAYAGHPVAGAMGALAMWLSRTPQGLAQLSNLTGIASKTLEGLGAAATKTATATPGIVQGAEKALAGDQTLAAAPRSMPQPTGPSVFNKNQDMEPSIFKKLSKAVETVESGGKADAVSNKGAVGTHQVTPIAMREVMRSRGIDDKQYTNEDLTQMAKQPGVSKEYGDAYLNLMLARYDGDIDLSLAAYNAGPTAVDKLLRGEADTYADIRNRLPAETRAYVPKIKNIFEKA